MEAKGTRLVRRHNDIWYIVWTGDSRGRSTGTRDRREAERSLATFIQQGGKQTRTSTGLTIAEALTDYYEEHVKVNAMASQKFTNIAVQYCIAHFPADLLVADMGDVDFEGYIAARRQGRITLIRAPKPASDGTLRRELGVIIAAFQHAARKKRISKLTLPHVPQPKPPAPRQRWLTADEEGRLIAACPVTDGYFGNRTKAPDRLSRIYRFLMLALDTAARRAALETLTWFQVDLVNGTINLNPPGRRQTNKRRAVIRISSRLRTVLERARREATTGFVLDHDGGIETAFQTIVERSGLADVTPHILRHTWATRAAQAGVSMREIADFLGNSITTVEKNYYHFSPHYLKGAADWREREQQAATTKAERER